MSKQNFSQAIVGEVPFHEGADFFLRIRDFGQQKEAAAPKTDAELKEQGRERAVTNLSAEAHREAGRRGERFGGVAGRVIGGITGASLGKKHLGKHPLGTVAGMVMGSSVGGSIGRELGQERDIKKNAAAVTAFKLAMKKVAYSDVVEAPPTYSPSNDGTYEAPQAPDQLPPDVEEPQAATEEHEPVHYMEAEQLARAAQDQNESAFYRQVAEQAQGEAQAAQEQLGMAQQQVEMLTQQQAATEAQIQAAQNETMMAQENATAQTMAAAQLRMGIQKLRAQMMEVASQDPMALAQPDPMMAGQDPNAAAAQDPNGQQAQPQDPAAQQGAPAVNVQVSPQAPAQPSAAPQDPNAQKTAGLKEEVAKRAPYAAGGAAAGALTAVLAKHKAPALRDKVQNLSGQNDFKSRSELGKAQGDLAHAERAERKPGRAALAGSLAGGALLAAAGPQIAAKGKALFQNISQLRK